jgi:hypothetical protein
MQCYLMYVRMHASIYVCILCACIYVRMFVNVCMYVHRAYVSILKYVCMNKCTQRLKY